MQLATLLSAMAVIWEDTTPPGLPNPECATLSNTNTIRMTKTAAQFRTTFQQLWILIHQLKELNIQFAEFLQTLPIQPLSRMIPHQPSAKPLTQLTQLKEHPNNSIPTLITPSLPTQAVHHLTRASYHCLPPWPPLMTPLTTGITKHQTLNISSVKHCNITALIWKKDSLCPP